MCHTTQLRLGMSTDIFQDACHVDSGLDFFKRFPTPPPECQSRSLSILRPSLISDKPPPVTQSEFAGVERFQARHICSTRNTEKWWCSLSPPVLTNSHPYTVHYLVFTRVHSSTHLATQDHPPWLHYTDRKQVILQDVAVSVPRKSQQHRVYTTFFS